MRIVQTVSTLLLVAACAPNAGLRATPDAPRIEVSEDGRERKAQDSALPFRTHCVGPLRFADVELEAAVRRAVNKPHGPLLADEIEAPLTIDIDTSDSLDLSGIECLPMTTSLDLSGVVVEDFAPLTMLNELTKLTLSDSNVTRLDPLAGVKNLSYLSF